MICDEASRRKFSLFKLERARIALQSRRRCEWRVEFGATGTNPLSARRMGEETRVQVSNDQCVFGLRRLGESAAVRIQNHGVAGANLVVVHADTVAEDEKQAVIVCATGQPPHQPAAALVASEFAFDRLGVSVAIVPEPTVDQAHEVWVFAAHTTRLVRRNEEDRKSTRLNSS